MQRRGTGAAGTRRLAHPTAWALTALVHPVSLLCIATLLVNDRVLKVRWPGPVTGKVSDVVGLAFFPLVVAALLGVLQRSPRWTITMAVTVTGVWFTLMKTVPAAAGLTGTAVTGLLGGGARVVVDPTDVLALPAMAWALHAWRPPRRRPWTPARLLVLLVAAFLSLATSQSCPGDATDLAAGDGVVITDAGHPDRISSDGGRTWRPVTDADDPPVLPGTTQQRVCLPDTPPTCVRLDGDRILATTDGGATWRVEWAFPRRRQRFVERAASPGCGPYWVRGQDVVALDGPDATVLAAMGDHGVLRRNASGTWRSAALDVPDIGVVTAAAGSHIWPEYVLASGGAAALYIFGSWAAWGRLRRRGATPRDQAPRIAASLARGLGGAAALGSIAFAIEVAWIDTTGTGGGIFVAPPVVLLLTVTAVGVLATERRWSDLLTGVTMPATVRRSHRWTLALAAAFAAVTCALAYAWSAAWIDPLLAVYTGGMVAVAVVGATAWWLLQRGNGQRPAP